MMRPREKQHNFPKRPLSERETAAFCLQLSALSASGLPEALLFAAESAKGRVRAAALAVREDVLAGMLLSEAFEKEKFSPAVLPFLRLAERSGSYERGLALAAEASGKRARLQEAVRGTLGYPLLLLVLLFAVFLVFAALVLPVFEDSFAELGLALPALTKAVLAAGQSLLAALPYIAGGAVLLVLLVLLLRKFPAAREKLDALRLCSRVEKSKTAAQFCLALSMLLKGGATLTEALGMVPSLLSNARAKEGVRRARAAVFAGCPLFEALKEERIFPPFLLSLIAAGEKSGSVGELLEGALPTLEAEYAAAIKVRANVLRTLLFALLAAMLVLLFAALYEPILLLLTAGI